MSLDDVLNVAGVHHTYNEDDYRQPMLPGIVNYATRRAVPLTAALAIAAQIFGSQPTPAKVVGIALLGGLAAVGCDSAGREVPIPSEVSAVCDVNGTRLKGASSLDDIVNGRVETLRIPSRTNPDYYPAANIDAHVVANNTTEVNFSLNELLPDGTLKELRTYKGASETLVADLEDSLVDTDNRLDGKTFVIKAEYKGSDQKVEHWWGFDLDVIKVDPKVEWKNYTGIAADLPSTDIWIYKGGDTLLRVIHKDNKLDRIVYIKNSDGSWRAKSRNTLDSNTIPLGIGAYQIICSRTNGSTDTAGVTTMLQIGGEGDVSLSDLIGVLPENVWASFGTNIPGYSIIGSLAETLHFFFDKHSDSMGNVRSCLIFAEDYQFKSKIEELVALLKDNRVAELVGSEAEIRNLSEGKVGIYIKPVSEGGISERKFNDEKGYYEVYLYSGWPTAAHEIVAIITNLSTNNPNPLVYSNNDRGAMPKTAISQGNWVGDIEAWALGYAVSVRGNGLADEQIQNRATTPEQALQLFNQASQEKPYQILLIPEEEFTRSRYSKVRGYSPAL